MVLPENGSFILRICTFNIIAQITEGDSIFCKIPPSIHMDIIRPTIPLCKKLSSKPSDRVSFSLELYLIFPVKHPCNDGLIVKEGNLLTHINAQQRE